VPTFDELVQDYSILRSERATNHPAGRSANSVTMPTAQGPASLPTVTVSTSQTKLSRYTLNPNLKIKIMSDNPMADGFDAAEDEQAEKNNGSSNDFDPKEYLEELNSDGAPKEKTVGIAGDHQDACVLPRARGERSGGGEPCPVSL